MKQRLQKILSHAGIASRRTAERLMLEGRVQVDGEIVTELGSVADPDLQDIRVDGSRVRARVTRRYVAINKPPGYVTTRSDPGRRRTVMELLPIGYQSLFPVGRLDIASSGLLVLTDDGELAQRLTHPKYRVEKTYLVAVLGIPGPSVFEKAARGIVVEGERLSIDHVHVLSSRQGRDVAKPRTRMRVTLRQGKNREIRRLFRALGYPVVELHRERIGPLSVRGLAPGAFRKLLPAEVAALKSELPTRARRTKVK